MRKLLVLVGITAVARLTARAFATNCGGLTPCACGDTLMFSRVLDGPDTVVSPSPPCPASGLIIGANNITLDCNGHTIAGTGSGSGISLTSRTGVIIKNCHVKDFANNFELALSNSNTLKDNTSIGNTSFAGFFLGSSNMNVLQRNIATTGTTVEVSRGFVLASFSNRNALNDNVAVGNAFLGFDIEDSSKLNTLTGNTAINNGGAGFYLSEDVSQNVLNNNRAISNGSGGFIAISASFSNTFRGNDASGNGTVSGEPDCLDESSGGLSDGTNNTWLGNTGGTSSPLSICPP